MGEGEGRRMMKRGRLVLGVEGHANLLEGTEDARVWIGALVHRMTWGSCGIRHDGSRQ